MEGFQWIRLGAILALFLGSFYVLAPTLLQEDSHARLEETASNVGSTGRKGAELEVRFSVEEGSAKELAPLVAEKVKAAGVKISGVKSDIGEVVVFMEPGTARDDVIAAVARTIEADIYSLSSIVELPDPAPETLAEVAALEPVAALGGTVVPADATSVDAELAGGDALGWKKAPAEDAGLLAVAMSGAVQGLVEDADGTPQFVALVEDFDLASELGRNLPGRLEPVKLDVRSDDAGDDKGDAEVESNLPPWLVNVLPDTRMLLGLDLQGGIDLTLQVELDEALLSQANRDKQYLTDAAEREGIEITYIKRDLAQPIIWIESPLGTSELSGFVAQRLQGYSYTESKQDEAGRTLHGYAMTSENIERVQSQAMDQVLDQLRKRVAETKVRDPAVVRKGGGRISVQLPGMTDVQTAIDTLGTVAVLEFRLVDTEFSDEVLGRIIREAEVALPPDQFDDESTLNAWLWANGKLPETRIVLFEWEDKIVDEQEVHERIRPVIMKNQVLLTGNDINGAGVNFNPNTQEPYVTLDFKPQGGNVFCQVTSDNVGKPFAIILDSEVRSTPNIQERICNGSARITLNRSLNALNDANILATVLRTGSLNAPVSTGEVRTVGPSLGADAIRAGSIATAMGSLFVLVFMALWYGRAGLIADFALVLNVMLMLAGLSLFGWTLTLPGIAGIALTVGMAVDANIIIYERIREELRLGQNARKAVETGFEKAAVAVIDANVTTAIAGVVLFSYGNVTIQGFAVTLLIGIATTLITALFVTRSLLVVVTRTSTARLRL